MRLTKQFSLSVIFILFFAGNIFSQRGKDGPLNVIAANLVVNTISDTLAVNAAAGSTSITVGTGAGFNTGDLVLIIQMQGAKVNCGKDTIFPDTLNSIPSGFSYGNINNYYTVGNNEFAEITSVAGNVITLDCGLKNTYSAFSLWHSRKFSNTQVIRVPRYTTLNISGGGSVTCNQWNGKTGGVVAVEVKYTTTLSAAPSIDVSGKGFRGGAIDNTTTFGSGNYGSYRAAEGGYKGEGIGGDTTRYSKLFSGPFGRGSVANGGGAGDGNNAGGGGGSNAGNLAAFYDGQGNPVAGYNAAWNLEGGSFSTHASTGGGRGGYTFAQNNSNPTTTAPGNAGWGGDNRRNFGGLGGHPLDISLGRLYLGGGGGAGEENDGFAGAGGNGGGLVYILAYGNVGGTGTILANGANGATTTNGGGGCSGRDGAGGAGGGGTVVINTVGTINLTAATAISANGGNGGNATIYNFCANAEAYGPGGGGGGGYISLSGAGATGSVTGGLNGVVSGSNTSNIKTNFPPNGATKGGAGIIAAPGTVSSFSVSAAPQTICAGNTATLTATTSGTVPGGITINWYSAATGGAPLASGTTYTTPVLASTTVYYVGSCPGTYRDSVKVTVTAGLATPAPTATSASICAGQTLNLNANVAGVTYAWSGPNTFSSTSQNPTIPNATTAATGTYSLTVSNGSCSSPAGTVSVTVNSIPAAPAPTATSASVCAGQTINLNANTAATSYSWTGPNTFSSAAQNPTIPNATTTATGTYSLTVSNGTCTSTAGTVSVTVNALPATPVPTSADICAGQTLNLSANTAATSYSWTGPNTFSSASQNPSLPNATTAATGTYSLTISNGTCTSLAGTVSVTVNALPATPAPGATSASICAGQTINLNANTAATSYSWTGPNTFSSAAQSPTIPNATTAATGTYSLTVSNGTCTSLAGTVSVTVNALPAAPVPTSADICAGQTLNLSANTAATSYSWTGPNTFSSSSQNPTLPNATTAATGTYSLTVSNGTCSSTAGTVSVTVNALPATPAPTTTTAAICAGQQIDLFSNVGGVTYTWTGPNAFGSSVSDPSITGATTAATGTYSLTVSDGTCTSLAGTVDVSVNAIPATPAPTTTTAVICEGQQIDLFSNVAGVTYTWTGPNTFSSSSQDPSIPAATVAATGTYSLNISNGSCSSLVGTVSVTVNAIPSTPAPTSNSPVCTGQTINLFANVTGVIYSWTGPNSFSSSAQNPTIPSAGLPESGTYTLTVSSGSCTSLAGTVAVSTTSVADPTITAVSPLCQSASPITLNAATGGGNWSGNGITDANLGTFDPSIASAGTDTITYTLSGSCGGTDTLVISVTPNADASITNAPAGLCVSGSPYNLTTTQAGGTWTGTGVNAGGTFDPAAAGLGTWQLIYTISGSCGDADTVNITVNATADATINSVAAMCQNGGVITLTAAQGGGQWTGNGITDANLGTFDPSAAVAGTDTITYTISGSCGATDTVVINVTANADASITNAPASICLSASPISLNTAQPGGTWTGPGVNAGGTFDPSVVGVGTAQLIYTINGACGDADTVNIAVNSSSNATINPVASMCQNAGVLTLTAAQGGGTWSGNGITDANLGTFDPALATAGTDTITYAIPGACGATDTVVITVNALADATITNPPATLCSGNPATTLTATQGGGTWTGTGITNGSTGTFDPSVSGTGNFQVIYTISGSCGDADTITVAVSPLITSTINPAGPFCSNATSTTLTAANTGGTWSGNGITNVTNGTFDPATAGAGNQVITYAITGTCGSTSTATITVNASADATIGATPATLCSNATAVALTAAQGGGTWTGMGVNSSGIFNPSTAGSGSHQVIYTISGACGDADTVYINVNNASGLSFTNPPVVCRTGNVTFTTISGGSCSTLTWNFGDGNTGSGSNPTHTFDSTGIFTVTAICITAQGCVDSFKVNNAVTVNALPDPYFTIDHYNVGIGDLVTYTASFPNGNSIHWHFGEPSSGASDSAATNPASHAYSALGIYCTKLELFSLTTGCYNYSTGCIEVVADGDVTIPNIFTPNGDNSNDLFNIKTTSVKGLSCTIFDRWGLKMYDWDGINGAWDGKAKNGSKAPDGIYYYLVKYTDIKGDSKEVQGYVTLIN